MKHSTDNKRQLLDFSLLVLMAAVVYGRMLGYEFQTNWDDNWNILYNDAVRGLSWQNVQTAFTSYVIGAYVPLQTLSFMLDQALWGLNSGGFHATSILIHTVNTLLIYRLFSRWYADRMVCLAGSLLFLIHPVQVETVGWISDRKTLLAMFFFLLAWEGYCRYREAPAGKIRWWAYAATLTFFSLSLLSKSIAVIMPGVLVLYDHCFPEEGGSRLRLKDKIPFLAIACVVATVTMIGFSAPGGARVPYHGGTFLATFYSMLPVFCRYLGMLIWPANLSSAYAPTIHHSLDGEVAGAALLLGIVLLGGGWLFSRDRRLGFWVLFFFVGLFPVSQIVPTLSMMADRYLYFPMLGVSALAGSGCVWLRERIGASHHRLLYGLLPLPFLALSVVSFHRTAVWQDSQTLWSDAVLKEPASDKAWEVLGGVYQASGKNDPARQAYERGLKLNPANTEILDGLGGLYTETGELDKGYALLTRLLALKPTYVTGWAGLGTNYLKRGNYAETEKAYKHAQKLQPDAMQVVMLLGDLERIRGHFDQSRAYYLQVEAKGWDQPETAYHLACVEAMAGNTDESMEWLEKALTRGFGDFGKLYEDKQLSSIRQTPSFMELIRRYFPQ
ncbi:MAG: tetratricopeptide repeat protein [Verrucomicrobia bacterium]|nr:tetratricopeptide repeat protein [Deltaproteobacteria bacterium]